MTIRIISYSCYCLPAQSTPVAENFPPAYWWEEMRSEMIPVEYAKCLFSDEWLQMNGIRDGAVVRMTDTVS